MPEEKDLPQAREYAALHEADRDSEIPYTGMMLTTVVAEAARMLRLEHGPDSFDMDLVGIAIGPVVMLALGLAYLFLAPKEANYYFGYRTYFGMGSVHSWRFTQRLSGIVLSLLGLA